MTGETAMADVPAEHLKAYIRLMFPEEMTPQAKRILEQIIAQYEGVNDDEEEREQSSP